MLCDKVNQEDNYFRIKFSLYFSLLFIHFFFFWISLTETSVFKIQLESNFFSINLMLLFSWMTPDHPNDQFETSFIIAPLFTSPVPSLTSQFFHMYHTPVILNDLQLPKCTTSLTPVPPHVFFLLFTLFLATTQPFLIHPLDLN